MFELNHRCSEFSGSSGCSTLSMLDTVSCTCPFNCACLYICASFLFRKPLLACHCWGLIGSKMILCIRIKMLGQMFLFEMLLLDQSMEHGNFHVRATSEAFVDEKSSGYLT